MRQKDEEEEERRRREAEATSTSSSSAPTSANTMELKNTLKSLQGHLSNATLDSDGQAKVHPQQLANILSRLVSPVGGGTETPSISAAQAPPVPEDSDSDMGFTDDQMSSSLKRMCTKPPLQGVARYRIRGKGGKLKAGRIL